MPNEAHTWTCQARVSRITMRGERLLLLLLDAM
jgi:hypothetical protein